MWQEYLLDPAWNGKLRAKVTHDPDRAEVYIGSKDIVIVRGNDTTNLELPSAVYTTGEEIMVPLRDVFENDGVGAKVIYNPLQKAIVVTSKDNTVTLQVGSTSVSVKVNGKTETISKAPTVVDGVTFVPVKFIAEKLGHVAWVYKDTKTNRTEIIIPRSAMAFLYDGVE